MKKTKIIGAILGIVLFVAVIAGLTYAYATWSSGDVNKLVNTKCFDILYEKGKEINGTIMPSSDYTGGLSSIIKLNVNTKCNINAKGRLYLNTLEYTDSNLYREGLLNYQVMRNDTTVIASGSITSSGEIIIDLGLLAQSETALTRYEIFIWLDERLIENSDVLSVYGGSIRAEVVQADGDFSLPNKGYNLVDYINNLYTSESKTIVKNGYAGSEIEYNYATSVNLMNDRLGGVTENYDAGNIRYYGSNPNNYIDLGDRDSDGNPILYRIIGLFKDIELADGTTQDLIKIIIADSIGQYQWDVNKSNDWSGSYLKRFLNCEYEGPCWARRSSYVENVVWNLGGTSTTNVFSNDMYKSERDTVVSSDNTTQWTGEIALMYTSDYGYATDFRSCDKTLFNYENSANSYACRSNDWLYNGTMEWQLTHDYDSSSSSKLSGSALVNRISTNGYAVSYLPSTSYDVRPTFYLKSEIEIMRGSGKVNDPYVVLGI